MILTDLKERFCSRYYDYSYLVQEKSFLLLLMVLMALLASVIGTAVQIRIYFSELGDQNTLQTMIAASFGILTSSIFLILLLKGKYQYTKLIIVLFLTFIFTLLAFINRERFYETGVFSLSSYILLLIAMSAIFDLNKIIWFLCIYFFGMVNVIYTFMSPNFDPVLKRIVLVTRTNFSICIFIMAFTLYYLIRITNKYLSRTEEELAKNKELNANLEQKVIERTQRIKNIETSLRKYLPKQLVESITKGGQVVEPKTERRKLTVFFSDIKGFTALTEFMEAEDMASLLNEYLTEMTLIANKWEGTVDKFVGDAIMIFFGAPEDTPDKENALNCVKMAIEMQERMKELQTKWFKAGIENPLEIRIGISTGTATVGNFGAEDRLSYTVIGSQVNIASRLEGICKPNKIKISHPTWALINEKIKCEPGEKVKVKGISKEIMTYNVLLS